MNQLVDLLSKLVIGTFTFLGPSFTLLIPVFFKEIKRLQETTKARIANLADIEKGNNSTELEKLIKDNKVRRNLLSPKRQVRRLFTSLLISLAFIGLYYFEHSHFWNCENLVIKGGSIVISVIAYVYCLFALWQIFCTIISAKLAQENESAQLNKPLQS